MLFKEKPLSLDLQCGVTEGEYDCMAFTQSTRFACVSLPNGASNLPNQLTSTLKRCKKIFLWMDFDELGQLNLEVFAKKLGLMKTHLIKQKNNFEIIRFLQEKGKLTFRFVGQNWIHKLGLDPAQVQVQDSGTRVLEKQEMKQSINFKNLISKSISKNDKYIDSDPLTKEPKEEEDTQTQFKIEDTEELDVSEDAISFLNELYCRQVNKPCTDPKCLESSCCLLQTDQYFELSNMDDSHLDVVLSYLEDHPIKDANDALLISEELVKMFVDAAESIPEHSIVTFSDIRDLIKDRIFNIQKFEGVKASREMNWFNKYLKGFRRGEFTILTGHTGSGKTTFLNQYSLEFAKKGIPTLFCSFELKNEVVLTNMIRQFSGESFDSSPDRFEYWAEQFQSLPMYFQKLFGSTTMDKVIQIIDYTVEVHGVTHVVLDNLQFMLGTQGKGFEKFDLQDELVSRLRGLATDKNIHVTLVIHPRKSIEHEDLSIASIFGTAKAIQESDNILIIQNREKFKVIDIKKNRFDGELGRVPVIFNKDNKRFVPINLFELEGLLGGKTVADLLKDKSVEVPGDKILTVRDSDFEVNRKIDKVEESRQHDKVFTKENTSTGGNQIMWKDNKTYVGCIDNYIKKKKENTQTEKLTKLEKITSISNEDSQIQQLLSKEDDLLKNQNKSFMDNPSESHFRKRPSESNHRDSTKDRSAHTFGNPSHSNSHQASSNTNSFDILKEMRDEEANQEKNNIGKFWVDHSNVPNFYESGRSSLNYEQVVGSVNQKKPTFGKTKSIENKIYKDELEFYMNKYRK